MDNLFGAVSVIAVCLLITFLRTYWFQEKVSKEPQVTVRATVISKEVKSGTHQTGRSKGGYSYTVTFLTEDGKTLELFAFETEFGSLREGKDGQLTYKGRYFVAFSS